MKTLKEYIDSGILEEYVLGLTSEAETMEIGKLYATHPEISKEIDSITGSLISYSEAQAPVIDPTVKPMLLAIVDYTERIKSGEIPSFPPELNENSVIPDFKEWTTRADMTLTDDFEDFYAKIIGFEPARTTAIAWLKSGSPEEIHHSEYEKFLILEGTCDIRIDGKVHSLVPGDYLSIPLYLKHDVRVTSQTPCKIILQRIAA